MDISKYLAKLVENRKEVGIPGLGTFYKKKSPGRYDTQSHSFVPPTFTLQFKTEVSEQSELAEYIHVDRNISVASANYFISQYVEELQEKLKVFAEAEIGTLGKLVSTAGILSFVPTSPLNSETNFFGLPKLKEESLGTSETTAEIKEESAQPGVQQIIETPVATTPGETVPEPIVEQPEVTKPKEQVIVSGPLQTEQVKEHIPEPSPYVDTPLPPVYTEPEVVIPTPVEEPVHDNKLESITNDNLAIEENPGQDSDFAADPIIVTSEKNPGEIDPLFIINELVLEEEKNNIQRMAEEVPQEPEAKTPLYLIVLLGFLGILVAFLIIYFMFPTLSSDFNNNYDDSTKKQEQGIQKPAEAVKPIDTIRTDTISKHDSALNTKSIPAVAEVVDTVPATYEVIGSSPKRQLEAKQFIAEMKTKYGIRAKIVEQIPGRKMKISIATFKTKIEADNNLPILSKKIGIDGLYTFKNTQKL